MLLKKNFAVLSSEINCAVCHGKLVFDTDVGEKICSTCGVVVKDSHDVLVSNMVDPKYAVSEYQSIMNEHTSHMMYDINLPSVIGSKNVDVNGKQFVHTDIDKIRRLDKFTISNNPKTRNLNKAIREIRRITEILGIKPVIAERACYIYRKALSKGLIRGRSITGIAAATIYIACKEIGIPHSIDEIDGLLENINKKNIVRYYKFLLRQMKLNVSLPSPTLNISRIAKRVGLGGRTERKALEILTKVEGSVILSGKKPASLAAAALYLASIQTGEHTTQLRIAIAADLTTITIRKRYLEIIQTLESAKSAELVEEQGLLQSPVIKMPSSVKNLLPVRK